jgi:signal transduction histidine kinase
LTKACAWPAGKWAASRRSACETGATPDGRIRISVAGGTVGVSDDGPGIPPDDLPYIFDRFYPSAKARALPGSGLGLAIVRRIADIHDGTVEAIPLQQGVKFRIRVPEIVVDPPPAEQTTARS